MRRLPLDAEVYKEWPNSWDAPGQKLPFPTACLPLDTAGDGSGAKQEL